MRTDDQRKQGWRTGQISHSKGVWEIFSHRDTPGVLGVGTACACANKSCTPRGSWRTQGPQNCPAWPVWSVIFSVAACPAAGHQSRLPRWPASFTSSSIAANCDIKNPRQKQTTLFVRHRHTRRSCCMRACMRSYVCTPHAHMRVRTNAHMNVHMHTRSRRGGRASRAAGPAS